MQILRLRQILPIKTVLLSILNIFYLFLHTNLQLLMHYLFHRQKFYVEYWQAILNFQKNVSKEKLSPLSFTDSAI